MKTRPGRGFFSRERCSGTVPRMLAISFGRFSMYSRSDGSAAAAAARGLLWPAQAPTCQVGGPPPGGGLYKRATKRHAEGRPLAWSRRGQGKPFILSPGPFRLPLNQRRVLSRRKPSLLCLRLKSAKQGCFYINFRFACFKD